MSRWLRACLTDAKKSRKISSSPVCLVKFVRVKSAPRRHSIPSHPDIDELTYHGAHRRSSHHVPYPSALLICQGLALAARASPADHIHGRLSEPAHRSVYLPGSDGLRGATTRWSAVHTPTVRIGVVSGVEGDVGETASLAHGRQYCSDCTSCS